MALTATATLPPSWDETIVPTLRKRLENESRLLAKRISAASIGSDDTPGPYKYSPPRSNTRQNGYSSTYHYQRPSAIPRPSIQQSRPSEPNGHVQQPPLPNKRPRTLSQPFPFEPPKTTSESPASRSASPQPSMPTRIPMKSRTESVSSIGQSNHTATTSNLNGRNPKDTYYAIDAIHGGPQHKASTILNEQPPFSSNYPDNDVDSARLSSESEERPFEHWYRGDVSRNGGVGELRVARRKEMLDIASYGHATKQAGAHSRSTSKVGEFADEPWQRRRGGSIGPNGRESFYLDNQAVEEEGMVLDERPLTDVEDVDPEPEMRMNYHFPPRNSPSPYPSPMATPVDSVARSPTSSGGHMSPTSTVSRIPTPSQNRQFSDSPRSPTPTGPPRISRGASEPMPSSSSSTSPPSPRSQPSNTRARSQTPTRAATGPPTPRSKGRSPAKNMSSSSRTNGTAKKSSKSPPSAMRRAQEEEKDRRSVAVYPTPDGEDMENAIPVWTQPVAGSNWDEVVIPVVARKRGLNGQYEMTDGSPKVVQVRETVPEPAPGTFGYDHTKYKPPRTDWETVQGIQMDEFGQQRRHTEEHAEEEEIPSQQPRIEDIRPIQPMESSPKFWTSPPTSPVPFAHYGPKDEPSSTTMADRGYIQPNEKTKADSDEAGCCKCVIM